MDMDKLRQFLALAGELGLTDLETHCYTSPFLRLATQVRDEVNVLWTLEPGGLWVNESGQGAFANLVSLGRAYGPLWPTKFD